MAITLLLALVACKGGDDGDDTPLDDTAEEIITGCDTAADRDCDGVENDLDCGPDDPYTYPGANDIPYDGVDNDCAGDGDEVDLDDDGYIATQVGGDDCNDGNPEVYPGAPEVCYDGIDQDCAGDEDTYDCDGDGYDGRGDDATDCDDEDATVNPGAAEIWYDGLDADCSGHLDSDYDADRDGDDSDAHDQGDGVFGTDCDDDDPLTAGGLPEIWDGVDRNCDGSVDNMDVTDAYGAWYGDAGIEDGFLGWSLATWSDHDADGYGSIAIGGYGTADGGYTGAVYLVDVGDADGKPGTVGFTSITGSSSIYLGTDLANVGDMDGDGYDELLVGSPLVTGNGAGILYLGSDLAAGGALSESDNHAYLNGDDYSGFEVAGLGDIDNDGVNDLGVGIGWFAAGHLVAYSGAEALDGGTLNQIDAMVQIDSSGDGGDTVAGLDYNADGIDDVVFPSYTTGNGVLAFLPGEDGLDLGGIYDTDLAYMLGESDDAIGLTGGYLDDIDGNGYPELMVRSYGHAGGATDGGGRIYVIDTSTINGDIGQEVESKAMYIVDGVADYGHIKTPPRGGDIDGDGVEDMLVVAAGDRAWAWDLEGESLGKSAAWVHWSSDILGGGTQSADLNADQATFNGRNDNDLTGYTVLLEDLDADGLPELIFGSPASSAFAGHAWTTLNFMDQFYE